jgi:cholesterol transport system auxiliary component
VIRIDLAIAGAVLAGLAGCAGGFRSDVAAEQTYVLRAAAVQAPPLDAPASLQVVRPLSGPGLETDRIMVLRSDRRLDFVSGSRWASDVPVLVESLAVDTLRGGAFSAVYDSFAGLPADYVLRLNVRRFEADYTVGDRPRVFVTFECVLGRRDERRALATFTAEGSADASASRVTALVAAFETAVNAALGSLAEQTYSALRTTTARSPP